MLISQLIIPAVAVENAAHFAFGGTRIAALASRLVSAVDRRA